MRKIGWFVIGVGTFSLLVKFFNITIISLGIIFCLVLIRKAIINRFPKINTQLKWGGKL